MFIRPTRPSGPARGRHRKARPGHSRPLHGILSGLKDYLASPQVLFVIDPHSFGSRRASFFLLGIFCVCTLHIAAFLLFHAPRLGVSVNLRSRIPHMSMTREAVAQDASFAMATVSERPVARPTSPAASPKVASAPVVAPSWNTKDLGLRLGVDVVSAASAGALTCPLIAIIDR